MTEPRGKGALILIGAPLVLLLAFFVLIVLLLSGGTAATACSGPAGTADPEHVPAEPVAGYASAQLKNAAHIMNAASALDLGRNAQVIGVMVAMGESSLVALDRGDTAGPDSRGLFQQRGNGAWGSYEDRMDPTISATNFFKALIPVSGWESLEPTIAAHKVQGNADPYHYARYFTAADQVVRALAGGAGGGCTSGSIVFPLSPGFTMTDDYGPRSSPTHGASSWHPADDLQHFPNPCGDQIYSITSGTVTYVGGYQVTIKSPAGYDVTYMHMKLSDVSVTEGDRVTPSQPIALVGNEGPSTGCHLDIRINKTGSTDASVSALTDGVAQGGPASTAGYVNPEEFYALFGMELCAPDSCRRNF
ncbi:M23 family metallopeptidase [Cryobacterium sp. GrIS_2_6]|uniref:M23 family metallopeptidase n=1 Tax=Cryobacterium sp. GrIS_2_6 TaxID=3162785 RepID=UPI002E02020A|nr:murein DD-endopeptidase MepM/ murein hydrolase activator NlpD [Cryobacterium psychrotolerans]